MASVNAASTIHSQSTLSRKYDVDTSTIFNLAEQFNDGESSTKNSSSIQLLQAFSLDTGRFDFHLRWINTLRLFIFPFFLSFSSFGFILIKTDEMNSISRSIFNVLRYIMIFTPEDTSFTVVLSVNLILLIVYISLIIFLTHLIFLYKNDSCPTNFQITFWVFFSRIIMPLFTTYISHLFSESIYNLISNRIDNTTISSFIISIPLILIQILYIFLCCSVYNATPIIRSNDISQLWFSYSRLDWMLNLILFFQVLFQYLLLLIGFPACCFVYFILITAISVSISIMIILRLPYIHPKANSIVLLSTILSPLCSITPIIAYYQKNHAIIALLIAVVLIIIFFFIAKFIINKRIQGILLNFAKLSEIDPDELNPELDPLSAAIMQLNPTRTIDFEKLGLKNEKDMSLYLRIGFLFNQQEVISNLFTKWATDQNIKSDLVLSACQVSMALQNDVRMLNTLEQLCHKLGSAPFNSHSFIIMFNHLRQGLLTQLNQPLLEAVGKAKRANFYLLLSIADFWEEVLKQRIDVMNSILPEISNEMIRANKLFQRLMKHYPKAPTIFKETVIFYHKSVGDHVKTMEAQSIYNKNRNRSSSRESSSDSHSSTSFEDVDNDFRERMDPWIQAQKVISGMKMPGLSWLNALMIILVISMLCIPIMILVASLFDINNFQSVIDPIETIGNITYFISRIPQLLRRKQLIKLNETITPPDSTGTPMNSILEFFTEDAILPSLKKYDELILNGSDQFLSLCSSESVIYSSCIDATHPMITGATTKSSTAYEILMSYEVSLNNVIQQGENFNWLEANTTTELLFVFNNFDELFSSFFNVFDALVSSMNDYREQCNKFALIFLVLVWVYPIIIILPILIITIFVIRKDITFMLNLFILIPKNEISMLRWATKAKKNSKANRKFQQKLANQSPESSEFDSTMSTTEKKEIIESQILTSRKTSYFFLEFIVCFVVFILFTAIMTSIGIYIFYSSMKEIITVSGAYVQSIKVSSNALASYIWTQEIFSENPILYNASYLKVKSHEYMNLLRSLFDDFFFLSNNNLMPAILLGDDVLNQIFVSKKIEMPENFTVTIDPINGILHEVYSSLSCDANMRLLDEISRFIYSDNEHSVRYTFKLEFVYHYEHLLFVHMNQFFQEMTILFRDKMSNENKDNVDQIALVYVVMFTVMLIFLFTVLLSSYFTLKHHILIPKNLMQLVSPEALLKSQTIVKWLNGTITSKSRIFSIDVDRSNHSKSLLTDFVIKYTKTGLMVTDENGVIIKINDVVKSLFKTNESHIMNHKLTTFLSDHLIDKDKNLSLKTLDNEIMKMREGASKTNKYSFYSSIIGSKAHLIHLFIQIEGFSDQEDEFVDESQFYPNAHGFSVTIVDQTTEYNQKMIVEKEKKKSLELNSYIMPLAVRKLFEEGETEISFEVAKATILFSSIFNWNDIVQSKNSSQVVSLLNKLFNSYDELLDRFPSITKISTKCDVYVVAAGLFRDSSSVNSAQFLTEFALQMLEVAEDVSRELDISIQVTIGVNTGGPIICGIVGRMMPAFEIIGDAVNEASIANANGVPRCIHITENTYEDIKYMNISIRERESSSNNVMNDNENKKTYLISLPKNHND